ACVLYELLTGEPPFVDGDAQKIIAQHLTDAPRPVRARAPRVPRRIEWALKVALSKDRADRFGTASEFAAALVSSGAWWTGAGSVGRRIGRTFPKRAP